MHIATNTSSFPGQFEETNGVIAFPHTSPAATMALPPEYAPTAAGLPLVGPTQDANASSRAVAIPRGHYSTATLTSQARWRRCCCRRRDLFRKGEAVLRPMVGHRPVNPPVEPFSHHTHMPSLHAVRHLNESQQLPESPTTSGPDRTHIEVNHSCPPDRSRQKDQSISRRRCRYLAPIPALL